YSVCVRVSHSGFSFIPSPFSLLPSSSSSSLVIIVSHFARFRILWGRILFNPRPIHTTCPHPFTVYCLY
ncbi:hypothetical protein AMATHDRAFT_64969, partial [Amanita thiersii Skay4041]